MKVLVALKRVIDYAVPVRVKADKSGVEATLNKLSTNPFCEIALEEAMRLKEAKIATEVVAVSAGPKSALDTLRQAYGFGVDRAIHIPCEHELQPLAVAKLLAAIAKREQPDICLLGKQAIDDDCNQTGQMLAGLLSWPQATFASKGQMLAGLLSWPQATFASKVEIDAAAKQAVVTREVDGGALTLSLKLPVVITTDLRLNTPRFVTLPNVMKAKKKAIESLTPEALGVSVSPQLEMVTFSDPPKRRASCSLSGVAGSKVASVAELVDRLKNEAKVLGEHFMYYRSAGSESSHLSLRVVGTETSTQGGPSRSEHTSRSPVRGTQGPAWIRRARKAMKFRFRPVAVLAAILTVSLAPSLYWLPSLHKIQSATPASVIMLEQSPVPEARYSLKSETVPLSELGLHVPHPPDPTAPSPGLSLSDPVAGSNLATSSPISSGSGATTLPPTTSVSGATPLAPTKPVSGATPAASTTSVSRATPLAPTKPVSGATPAASTTSVSEATPAAPTTSVSGATPAASTLSVSGAMPLAPTKPVSGATPTASTNSVSGATPAASTMSEAEATPATSTTSEAGATPAASTLSPSGATPLAPTKPESGATPAAPTNSVPGTTPSASTASEVGATPAASTTSEAGATPLAPTNSVSGATPAASTMAVSGATPAGFLNSVPGATPATSTTPSRTQTPQLALAAVKLPKPKLPKPNVNATDPEWILMGKLNRRGDGGGEENEDNPLPSEEEVVTLTDLFFRYMLPHVSSLARPAKSEGGVQWELGLKETAPVMATLKSMWEWMQTQTRARESSGAGGEQLDEKCKVELLTSLNASVQRLQRTACERAQGREDWPVNLTTQVGASNRSTLNSSALLPPTGYPLLRRTTVALLIRYWEHSGSQACRTHPVVLSEGNCLVGSFGMNAKWVIRPPV
eukprot:gene13174-30660_t